MPYKNVWVTPSVFLKHLGVTVWCVYPGDNALMPPHTFIYTVCVKCDYSGCGDARAQLETLTCKHMIDIRELPFWHLYQPGAKQKEKIRKLVMHSIQEGHLTSDGIKHRR